MLSFGIPWRGHFGLVQVFLGGVSGDVEPPGGITDGYVVAAPDGAIC